MKKNIEFPEWHYAIKRVQHKNMLSMEDLLKLKSGDSIKRVSSRRNVIEPFVFMGLINEKIKLKRPDSTLIEEFFLSDCGVIPYLLGEENRRYEGWNLYNYLIL